MRPKAVHALFVGLLISICQISDAKVLDISATPKEHRKEIFISGEILEDNKLFDEAIEKTSKFTSKDVVIVHIDSVGGRVDLTYELLLNMKRSKATYIASIEGVAFSAAATIAVQCDVIISRPNTIWVFHMIRYRMFGLIYIPDRDVPDQSENLKLLKSAPLTQQEWDRMTLGKYDVFITGEEVNARLGDKAKVIGLKVVK
jgi:ATP-dependent protease ClpP protease subunit